MQFNEYIPNGGWIKFNARKLANRKRREALANTAISAAIITSIVVAYWLAAILEHGV